MLPGAVVSAICRRREGQRRQRRGRELLEIESFEEVGCNHFAKGLDLLGDKIGTEGRFVDQLEGPRSDPYNHAVAAEARALLYEAPKAHVRKGAPHIGEHLQQSHGHGSPDRLAPTLGRWLPLSPTARMMPSVPTVISPAIVEPGCLDAVNSLVVSLADAKRDRTGRVGRGRRSPRSFSGDTVLRDRGVINTSRSRGSGDRRSRPG